MPLYRSPDSHQSAINSPASLTLDDANWNANPTLSPMPMHPPANAPANEDDHTPLANGNNTLLAPANMQTNGKKSELIACIFCSSTTHASLDCSKFCTASDRRVALIKRGLCIDCFLDGRHESCPLFQLKQCSFCKKSGRMEALDHSCYFCPYEFPEVQATNPRNRPCASDHKDPCESAT